MSEKEYTRDEVGEALRALRDKTGVSCQELAKRLGCSASTIIRLETGESLAADELYDRLLVLTVLGKNNKVDTTAEMTSGASGGVAGATAAGTVNCLSLSGMASGLAALGLGSMVMGVGVVAAIPFGFTTYGMIKGLMSLVATNRLNCEAVDDVLEIRLKTVDPK